MLKLLKKYDQKLVNHGLCLPGAPLIGGINDTVTWNRTDPASTELEKVINNLNINSLIFARPSEPFATILDYLCSLSAGELVPEDTETRTFLHSIPIARELCASEIVPLLQRRKGCILANRGVITYGTVSPEQAFVIFSSIIFSTFVKFFVDVAYAKHNDDVDPLVTKMLPDILEAYDNLLSNNNAVTLDPGPFDKEEEIIRAMANAGQATVDARMVDSFFGNISYFNGDTVYISQTGSSMDELKGCIDACPLDNSTCTGITASSELVAHRDIYLNNNCKAILHGHPKFSVIMSMLCYENDCTNKGKCHIKCDKRRFLDDIPIIPGEVGTGPRGISNTLPPAVQGRKGAIVYGHGVFTVGTADFKEAFRSLGEIEERCRKKYLELVLPPA